MFSGNIDASPTGVKRGDIAMWSVVSRLRPEAGTDGGPSVLRIAFFERRRTTYRLTLPPVAKMVIEFRPRTEGRARYNSETTLYVSSGRRLLALDSGTYNSLTRKPLKNYQPRSQAGERRSVHW